MSIPSLGNPSFTSNESRRIPMAETTTTIMIESQPLRPDQWDSRANSSFFTAFLF
jgi:hypothetical protein